MINKPEKPIKKSILFLLVFIYCSANLLNDSTILPLNSLSNSNKNQISLNKNQTNISPILQRSNPLKKDLIENKQNINEDNDSKTTSLIPLIRNKLSILNLKKFGKKNKHLKKKETKIKLKKKLLEKKSNKKILSIKSNKIIDDKEIKQKKMMKKIQEDRMKAELQQLKKKANLIPDQVFINLINQKKISDDLFIKEDDKKKSNTILSKYDKSTNSLKKEKSYQKRGKRIHNSLEEIQKNINDLKYINFVKEQDLKEIVDSEQSWLKYNKDLEAIQVYPGIHDFNSLGTIELPSELKLKIKKYEQEFFKMKKSILNSSYSDNKSKFKKFMKKIYNLLKSETEILNHQKIMAQTKNYVRKENSKKLKDQKMKLILHSISQKISSDIMKEKERIQNNDYKKEDVLTQLEKEKMKENTHKIFELMDLSDFGNQKYYAQIKEILELYMDQGEAGNIQLRENNCLIDFKKNLLSLLEDQN